jgi:hypothetical protein
LFSRPMMSLPDGDGNVRAVCRHSRTDCRCIGQNFMQT